MITFDVTPDGGSTVRVVATSRDLDHWERTTKGASLANLEAPKMRDLVQIAYLASVRHGHYEGSYDTFRDGVDVAPVNPTQLAKEAAERDDEGEDESGPTPRAR